MDSKRKVGEKMGQTLIAEVVAASSPAAACHRRRRHRLLRLPPNPRGHCYCCSRMAGTRMGKKGGAVHGETRWKETGASPSLRAGPCSVYTVLVSLRIEDRASTHTHFSVFWRCDGVVHVRSRFVGQGGCCSRRSWCVASSSASFQP